jgi:hypothetical protein
MLRRLRQIRRLSHRKRDFSFFAADQLAAFLLLIRFSLRKKASLLPVPLANQAKIGYDKIVVF